MLLLSHREPARGFVDIVGKFIEDFDYALTPKGYDLPDILSELDEWTRRWAGGVGGERRPLTCQ